MKKILFILLLTIFVLPVVANATVTIKPNYVRTPSGETPTTPVIFTFTTTDPVGDADASYSNCTAGGFPLANESVFSKNIFYYLAGSGDEIVATWDDTTAEERTSGVFSYTAYIPVGTEVADAEMRLHAGTNGTGAGCWYYLEITDNFPAEIIFTIVELPSGGLQFFSPSLLATTPAELGASVSASTFSLFPVMLLSIGVFVAFYVIQQLMFLWGIPVTKTSRRGRRKKDDYDV